MAGVRPQMGGGPVEPGAGALVERLLGLEPLAADSFAAHPLVVDRSPPSVYGGQVLAQSLWAASATAGPGKIPGSLHGYFLGSRHAAGPTTIDVFRERDGRSLTARRVTASQDGRPIFSMLASFRAQRSEEAGAPEVPSRFQDAEPPDVPGPEGLAPGYAAPFVLLDVRDVPAAHTGTKATTAWIRCPDPLPDDASVHSCVLAYMSDIYTGMYVLPDGDRPSVSISHSIWFHQPGRLDDWVLLDLAPVSLVGDLGTYGGSIFDRSGNLLATLTQEMLFLDRVPESTEVRHQAEGPL